MLCDEDRPVAVTEEMQMPVFENISEKLQGSFTDDVWKRASISFLVIHENN